MISDNLILIQKAWWVIIGTFFLTAILYSFSTKTKDQ